MPGERLSRGWSTMGFGVHDGSYPHFITCSVVYMIPVFTREEHFRVLADSLNYCTEHKGLVVRGYVLMPNHFHMISDQSEGRIAEVMRDLKRHTSSTLLNLLQQEQRVTWLRAFKNAGEGQPKLWEGGFHPEQVHSQPFYQQKLDYMHANPVRAGFVEDCCHWKYSSAGLYYRGTPSLVKVTPLEF